MRKFERIFTVIYLLYEAIKCAKPYISTNKDITNIDSTQ